jgi:hypothetical protein
VEDIPKQYIRPITTGRLRLYKELTSSLRLIKKKIKIKLEDEKIVRNKLLNIDDEKETGKYIGSSSKRKKNISNRGSGPQRKEELLKKKKEILFIGMRPSDMAIELQKESDAIISNAIQGLPPPRLAYNVIHANKNYLLEHSNKDETDETDEKVKDATTRSIRTKKNGEVVMDMPNVGDVVAVQLKGWSQCYVGTVKNNRNIEHEVQEKRRKTTETAAHVPNEKNKQAAAMAKQRAAELNGDAVLWTIDVCFDDFELAVDQKWKEGVTARSVIDLNASHLVALTTERHQQYEFLKKVWLTRQKQEKEKDNRGKVENKEEKSDKKDLEVKKLSWDEQNKLDRRRAMRSFKTNIQSGKNWFLLPVQLDEFGFPIPEWSDDEDSEKEDEIDKEPPPFVIHR